MCLFCLPPENISKWQFVETETKWKHWRNGSWKYEHLSIPTNSPLKKLKITKFLKNWDSFKFSKKKIMDLHKWQKKKKRKRGFFIAFHPIFHSSNIYNYSIILKLGNWYWYNPQSLFRLCQFYMYLCVYVCVVLYNMCVDSCNHHHEVQNYYYMTTKFPYAIPS